MHIYNKITKSIKAAKNNPLGCCLGILLFLQFILTAYCNLFLLEKYIDCDTAKMFVHIREMWEQKEIFLTGWSYITTAEFDCGSLLALPLYGLTDNIFLAYGLANTIFCGLYIWTIFFLFRGQKIVYSLLAGNLILIPYTMGMLDYFNMMFFNGTQYIIKTLCPLMLVAILLQIEREQNRAEKIRLSAETVFFIVMFMVLLFVTSLSSGVYVMACGILPVIIAYSFYHFGIWKKIPNIVIGLGGLTIGCFLIGCFLNERIMHGARGNAMVLSPSNYMPTNILTSIVGMFELFGGMKNTVGLSVLSVDGILTIAKCVLVIVFLVCGICMCRWILQKKGRFAGNYFNHCLFVEFIRIIRDLYQSRLSHL